MAATSRIPARRALGAVARRARRLARRAAVGSAKRLGERFGFDVVDDPIYSPIPAVPPPEDPIWSRQAPGVEIDHERQLALIEQELAGFVAEFTTDVRARGFELWNGYYSAGDAEVLYALVRHLEPRRVLEIGSGFSTFVSAAACARNAGEGSPVELVAVDPHPRTELAGGIEGLARIERRDCRELPLGRFRELEAGDVLFIDSSHAVKRVLPQLNAGVYVHVHDVFLPYEYPRYLFQIPAYFSEQYLLNALLVENENWEVVLALCALVRRRPERMRELIPSLREDVPGLPGFPYVPAAFWLRRRG